MGKGALAPCPPSMSMYYGGHASLCLPYEAPHAYAHTPAGLDLAGGLPLLDLRKMAQNHTAPSPGASEPWDHWTGVKVIDMTTVLMGPYATQMLGDYGADVIKVETPDGDVTRLIGPTRHAGMGPVFLNTNRSKRVLFSISKSRRAVTPCCG